MPPISTSRSAPLISCTSPAARSASSQLRRSCLECRTGLLSGRLVVLTSAMVDIGSSSQGIQIILYPGFPLKAKAGTRSPHYAALHAGLSLRLGPVPIQNALQSLRRDRQLGHCARQANGVIDG